MAKRPDCIRLVEAGRTYEITFNAQGWIAQVVLETSNRKKGMIPQTVWRRDGGQKPLSERSAAAMERAITLREQARWDVATKDWSYPGKA